MSFESSMLTKWKKPCEIELENILITYLYSMMLLVEQLMKNPL